MFRKISLPFTMFLTGILAGSLFFSQPYKSNAENSITSSNKKTIETTKKKTTPKNTAEIKSSALPKNLSQSETSVPITTSVNKEFKIGFIDSQLIFDSHPKTKEAYEMLAKFKNDKQKELDKKLKAKFGGKSVENLSPELQEEAKKMFAEDNEEFKKEMSKKSTFYLEPIEREIIQQVKKTAQQKQFSAVFDKAAIVYGGTDLTNIVIKELKRKN